MGQRGLNGAWVVDPKRDAAIDSLGAHDVGDQRALASHGGEKKPAFAFVESLHHGIEVEMVLHVPRLPLGACGRPFSLFVSLAGPMKRRESVSRDVGGIYGGARKRRRSFVATEAGSQKDEEKKWKHWVHKHFHGRFPPIK
jgi:hypothetical protein